MSRNLALGDKLDSICKSYEGDKNLTCCEIAKRDQANWIRDAYNHAHPKPMPKYPGLCEDEEECVHSDCDFSS